MRRTRQPRGIGFSRCCENFSVAIFLAMGLVVTFFLAEFFSVSFYLICWVSGICAVCVLVYDDIHAFCFQRGKVAPMTVVHARSVPRGPERINPVNVFPPTATATRTLSALPPITRRKAMAKGYIPSPPRHETVSTRPGEGYITIKVVYEYEVAYS